MGFGHLSREARGASGGCTPTTAGVVWRGSLEPAPRGDDIYEFVMLRFCARLVVLLPAVVNSLDTASRVAGVLTESGEPLVRVTILNNFQTTLTPNPEKFYKYFSAAKR